MKKLLLLLLIFVLGITTVSAQNRIRSFWSDSKITFKIKSAFYRSPVVSAWRIGVKTRNGVVTLTGKAKSLQEKEEAEKIVRKFKSVRKVINKIEVKSSHPKEVFKTTKEEKRSWWRKVSDYAITGQIKTAFMLNKNVRAARINVSTKKGVVFLEGIVPSKKARDLAEKIALKVVGVKKVVNLLKVNEQN